MSNLQLIIKREFIARVRNRTFIIMTFLSPLIIVGLIGVITWLATLNSEENKIIAFVDETDTFATVFTGLDAISFINYSDLILEEAKDSVISKNFYGLLYIPKSESTEVLSNSITLYSKDSPEYGILRAIEGIVQEKLTRQNYKANGLDLSSIEKSKANVEILIENFQGEKTSKISNYVKMAFGGLAGYLLLMFVVIYGNMVMRSVIEEKTNRIIEIIISSVKPFHLMLGKILGTTLAGITQFVIWVIIGAVLLVAAQSFLGIDTQSIPIGQAPQVLPPGGQDELALLLKDILNLPLLSLVLLFFVYFIGGYFLYSSIYAAIGAAVDSETDSQQFMPVVVVPLVLSFYVGIFAVIENPNGVVSTVFSMIPLTSPVVMLMRVPFGVSWWEVLISILLLFGSIFGTVWFAAKIYRVGILMYGKKPNYKELFKWLKY